MRVETIKKKPIDIELNVKAWVKLFNTNSKINGRNFEILELQEF